MTGRARLAFTGAALLVPAALVPLLARPYAVFALAAGLAVVAAAHDSVAWPVGLAGIGVLIVGVLGENPFPDRSIAVFTFGWIALAVAFAVLGDARRVPLSLLLAPPIVLTVLLAVWQLVRLGASPSPAYGEYKLQLFLAQNLAFVVAGVLIARSGRDVRLYALLALLLATGSGALLVSGLSSGSAEAVVGGRFSASSGQSPIELGRQAALGLLVGVYVLLAHRRLALRLVALATMPLIAVAFVASGSRGPVVGLAGGLLVLLLLSLQRRESRLRVAFVAAGSVVAAIVVSRLVPPENVERTLSVITGSENGLSANGRFELWSEAWALFVERPLAGIGTGGFAAVEPSELYPHNLLFEVGAELGLVGLVLLGGVLGYAVLALGRAWRAGGEQGRPGFALAAALLASAFLNAMFSSNMPTNFGLWLAVGLATGLGALPAQAPGLRQAGQERQRVAEREGGMGDVPARP